MKAHKATILSNLKIPEEQCYPHGHANMAHSEIAVAIVRHNAMIELDKFGELLCSRAIDDRERKVFFATMWAFLKYVPSGIINLAAKMTDEHIESQTWEASAQAAYILYASIEEYGLQHYRTRMLTTHHQMFKKLITHFGITDEDIFNKTYIKPIGTKMGKNVYKYYRSDKLGEALGFHLASEMMSSRAFHYFLKGFQKHPREYNLIHANDPILDFFKVHCEIDPMHVETGRNMLVSYIAKNNNVTNDTMEGALAYMGCIEQMFKMMNIELAGRH